MSLLITFRSFSRTKTINLQNLKTKLMQEVELIESETKCVSNFQMELDMLIQEKLAHLEELRQIQNDILTVRKNEFFCLLRIYLKRLNKKFHSKVEKTMRQSEEEKKRALESVRRLHSEYKPLKENLNALRESIGLDECNSENDNDESVLIESFLRYFYFLSLNLYF